MSSTPPTAPGTRAEIVAVVAAAIATLAAQPRRPNGYRGMFASRSPRLFLEIGLSRGRRHPRFKAEQDRARRLAFSIHGLTMARLDGVPEDEVERELARLLA